MTPQALGIFRSILGDDGVRVLEDGGGHAFASHPRPLVVLEPPSVDALAEVVRAAARERVGLVPVGSDSHPRLPAAGTPPAALVHLRRLDRVIEHAHDDLTFTAEAGLALGEAQAIAGARGQKLGLMAAPQRTLGGIVASGAEGPTRKAYGLVRDQVLGAEIIHGDGRRTKAGGRVVKNVTGYDLCRLYTGSRGALGILTSLTFRLRAEERASAAVHAGFDDPAAAWSAAFALRREVPDLFALQVSWTESPRPAPPFTRALLVVTLRGEEALVASQVARCSERLRGDRLPHVRQDGDVLPEILEGGADLVVATLPADGARALEILAGLEPLRLLHDVETGVTELVLRDPNLSAEAEQALGQTLLPLGAIVDRPRDPHFHLRRLQHFPSTRPEGLEIMRGLMEALDPAGILNPGRHEVAR